MAYLSTKGLQPAVYDSGGTPTLDSDITAAEMRATIGALPSVAQVDTGNGNPAASAADSGKYFYRTSGATWTLPDITSVGEQYVLLNNTGSSVTISKHSSDTIIGSTSVDDDKAVTCVAVTSSSWFVVG